MSAAEARFVQFPHPGAEHVPSSDTMPWNTVEHRRKFLLAHGQYLDRSGGRRTGDVVFWGEWEPPSEVLRRWPAQGRLPRVLHRPYWTKPASGGFRQNTDPWVWGDVMIYSNCKQLTGPDRRPTSMQRLPEGSVIVFGSTIDGVFCADTVFVVATAEPWVPAELAEADEQDAFAVCTVGAIAASDRDAHVRLTLYRGATLERPVAGMSSFVPALPHGEDARFARPAIRVDGLINPASRQSTRGSKDPLPRTTVQEAWRTVFDQVAAAGLVHAVRLDVPPLEGSQPVPSTDRRAC